jgi:AGCS family alanine or glycine:cation symporter
VAALLFAFSTSVSWSYYGLKACTYLLGEARAVQNSFKLVFCAFLALGCMIQLDSVLAFSDAMVFLIAVPNILGLYFYAPEVRAEVRGYRTAIASGRIGLS